MLFTENTPRRSRKVQGITFEFPCPVTSEMCESLALALEINADGLARQLNQVAIENVSNNLAPRIKRAIEADEEVPTQDDLDEIYAAYDFSGVRQGGPGAAALSPLEKLQLAYCRNSIKGILKKSGKGSMPAPVTVAKKDAEPGPQQIAYDEFMGLVEDMFEGNGIWGESEPHMNARAEIFELAAEAMSKQQESSDTAEALTV